MALTYCAVHVTPRSGRDEVCGLESGAAGEELRLRVTAAPDDGKANAAVCKLVARSLHLPKGAVSVASGHASRHKRLAIEAPEGVVSAWLESMRASR